MRAMGIFEPGAADAMAVAFAHGIDPQRAIAAMRWDVVNPWGAVLEKLSSHPLVARRIQALEESGLPGAPKQWSVLRSLTAVTPEQRTAARARFGRELAIAVAPWAVLVPLVAFGAFTGSRFSIGLALALAGGLFFVKQTVRYPSGSQRVDEVASLLENDARVAHIVVAVAESMLESMKPAQRVRFVAGGATRHVRRGKCGLGAESR